MGQSQGTVAQRCTNSCCVQNYADAGTIRLEQAPAPENPVNWENLKDKSGQRQSITTGITISEDAPQHIQREFDGGETKRLDGRKATGFVYKNAVPEVSDGERSDETDKPEFGDTNSEREKNMNQLGSPRDAAELADITPGPAKKRMSVADELEAGLYDNIGFGSGMMAARSSGKSNGHPETKSLCVILNKERGKIGFFTDLDNRELLIITKIDKGLLEDWNKERQKGDRVTVGDCIVAVNNSTGPPNHLQEMISKYVSLKLDVRTHFEFHVSINKTSGSRLGLDVKAKKNNTTLPIVKLHEDGLVAQWNKTSDSKQVVEGDRVVAVNGDIGSAEFLKKQLKLLGGSVVITICRATRF